ncbi:hypothetical protein HPB49_005438 [Dermacentor silvarum]|uniref:Uncharacterized protein n=1 Tax=Dermacentor silvarum TaxID=543639 RepID=A0ACB8D387_DERSI|nr:hypothetical protein HPB49_005438 [Dermacentor silvarum]
MPYHVEGEELSPQEFEDDPRWSRAIRARNKIYPALKQAPASDTSALCGSPAGPGKPAALPQGKSASPKLKKHPPLPRLTATDFKIVFRPRGGLDLRPINGGALLPILCAGAEIDYNQVRSQDKLRINPHNNSLTVSTPSESRMKRYVQLQGLQLNDQQYPMKGYVAAPDNAIKGILYNAVYNQSQEEIFEDLVALNPSRTFTMADARQLGRTKSILVTFINTTEVPRQLNFYGAVYSCHPFKAKFEACFNCRKPGHRADVCPKERTGLGPRCGIAHPVKPTPDCTPKCILCGGAHFKGTRRCKVRFDRSGNSSNNTAKSTTRTTPPASPPPVSPPESSRNSRSHHRSPSRSRSRSRTSSRQGRHRSRSVSFPPLPGQKDQNIEKLLSRGIEVTIMAFLGDLSVPYSNQNSQQKAAGMYQACIAFAKSRRTETHYLVEWMGSLNLDLVNKTKLAAVNPVEMMVRGSLDLGVKAVVSVVLFDRDFERGKRVMQPQEHSEQALRNIPLWPYQDDDAGANADGGEFACVSIGSRIVGQTNHLGFVNNLTR